MDVKKEEVIMAKCTVCGNDIGFSILKYSVPDSDRNNLPVCKNCVKAAMKAGKRLQYDPQSNKIIMVEIEDGK